MSDLARAMAFAFRRKGVQAMPSGELQLLLAFDLRWFAPEDARRAVQRALETGLLQREGEGLRIAFDLDAVPIPLNFRPGAGVLDEDVPALPPARSAPPPAAPLAPVARVSPPEAVPAPSPAPARARLQAAAEEERRRRGLLLSVEAALLVVRRRAGEDVTQDAAALEAELLSAGAPSRSAAP